MEFDRVIVGSISVFRPATFPATDSGANVRDRPILVVGMPRSGTTLTEQILASHSDVSGAGELPELSCIAQRLSRPDLPYPASVALSHSQIQELGTIYLQTLATLSEPATSRTVDKMPHNFMYLGLAAVMFPRMSVVHCVRDPRDTGTSSFKTNLDWPFSDFTAFARFYRNYRKLMAHWKRVLPVAIHEVRYESLVDDPEGETRKLLEACELPWDPRCLDFHQLARSVHTPSRLQVRSPVYSSSVGSWQKFGPNIQPLLDALDAVGY